MTIFCILFTNACSQRINYFLGPIETHTIQQSSAIIVLGVDLSKSNLDIIDLCIKINNRKTWSAFAYSKEACFKKYLNDEYGSIQANSIMKSHSIPINKEGYAYLIWQIPQSELTEQLTFSPYVRGVGSSFLNHDNSEGYFFGSIGQLYGAAGMYPMLVDADGKVLNPFDILINYGRSSLPIDTSQSLKSRYNYKASTQITNNNITSHIQKTPYNYFIGCNTKIIKPGVYYLGELLFEGNVQCIVGSKDSQYHDNDMGMNIEVFTPLKIGKSYEEIQNHRKSNEITSLFSFVDIKVKYEINESRVNEFLSNKELYISDTLKIAPLRTFKK